jgi:hypothetical protein
VAAEIFQRPRKFAAEFSADFAKKMAEKGPNFFEVLFAQKDHIKSTELPDFFPYYHAFRIFANMNLNQPL